MRSSAAPDPPLRETPAHDQRRCAWGATTRGSPRAPLGCRSAARAPAPPGPALRRLLEHVVAGEPQHPEAGLPAGEVFLVVAAETSGRCGTCTRRPPPPGGVEPQEVGLPPPELDVDLRDGRPVRISLRNAFSRFDRVSVIAPRPPGPRPAGRRPERRWRASTSSSSRRLSTLASQPLVDPAAAPLAPRRRDLEHRPRRRADPQAFVVTQLPPVDLLDPVNADSLRGAHAPRQRP